MKIAVAGTGYVGLSIATLLAQHHRPFRTITSRNILPKRSWISQRHSMPVRRIRMRILS